MTAQRPRPESITDLPEHLVTQEMFRVRLTQDGAYNQMLVAVENLIHVLRHAYGDDALRVDFEGGYATANRVLESGEQAKLLTDAQQEWDREHDKRVEAAARKQLVKGDTFDVAGYDGSCRREVGDGWCALDYWHFGQCVAVHDGIVTGTRPGTRTV